MLYHQRRLCNAVRTVSQSSVANITNACFSLFLRSHVQLGGGALCITFLRTKADTTPSPHMLSQSVTPSGEEKVLCTALASKASAQKRHMSQLGLKRKACYRGYRKLSGGKCLSYYLSLFGLPQQNPQTRWLRQQKCTFS